MRRFSYLIHNPFAVAASIDNHLALVCSGCNAVLSEDVYVDLLTLGPSQLMAHVKKHKKEHHPEKKV